MHSQAPIAPRRYDEARFRRKRTEGDALRDLHAEHAQHGAGFANELASHPQLSWGYLASTLVAIGMQHRDGHRALPFAQVPATSRESASTVRALRIALSLASFDSNEVRF